MEKIGEKILKLAKMAEICKSKVKNTFNIGSTDGACREIAWHLKKVGLIDSDTYYKVMSEEKINKLIRQENYEISKMLGEMDDLLEDIKKEYPKLDSETKEIVDDLEFFIKDTIRFKTAFLNMLEKSKARREIGKRKLYGKTYGDAARMVKDFNNKKEFL